MKPAILGVWKNDILDIPQVYEFSSWKEALDFYKSNCKHFIVMENFQFPEVLPF